MTPEYLDEFLQRIAPFQHLWRSAQFVGYAGKIGDTWLFLGGRMLLSPKVAHTETLTKIADFDGFFAFQDDLPIGEVPDVLRDIVNRENIHMSMGRGLGFRDIALRLTNTPGSNNITRWPPLKFDRKMSRSQFGIDQIGYRWAISNDWQLCQLGATECLDRTAELLRVHTHVNGADSLASHYTPGLHLNVSQRPELQVIAPLLFQLEYDDSKGVRFTGPETTKPSHLRLKAFFGAHHATEKILGPEDHLPDKTFATTWNLEWPDGVDRVDIRLLYCDHDIDGLSVNRWASSASIRGAVNEYFDSKHNRLISALDFQAAKNSTEFEVAVVRLLNILGIPAIWYGKVSDPDRPDGAAVISEESSPVILLIECTREKPDQKFASMAARARDLKDFLKCKASILPVVFSATSVVSADLKAAYEHGVSVLGREEINELLGLVSLPRVSQELVLDYLRRFAARGSAALSSIMRFQNS